MGHTIIMVQHQLRRLHGHLTVPVHMYIANTLVVLGYIQMLPEDLLMPAAAVLPVIVMMVCLETMETRPIKVLVVLLFIVAAGFGVEMAGILVMPDRIPAVVPVADIFSG